MFKEVTQWTHNLLTGVEFDGLSIKLDLNIKLLKLVKLNINIGSIWNIIPFERRSKLLYDICNIGIMSGVESISDAFLS